MIGWTEINELQNEKKELQLKLNELLNKSNVSIDEINAIKSEIIYLDKRMTKILGTNELKRLEELRGKNNIVQQRDIKMYYSLKDKYRKISKMSIALKKLSNLIDSKFNTNSDLEHEERMKVK